MEVVPNGFDWMHIKNKNPLRIDAGNVDYQYDGNSISETDLQEEQTKPNRKKRLKRYPSEFISMLNRKNDKYGITAAFASKSTKKTPGSKKQRTLKERLQNKISDPKQESTSAPSSSLKTKNIHLHVNSIRKVPHVLQNEPKLKKIKLNKEAKEKSTSSKASPSNSTRSKKSIYENPEQKPVQILKVQPSTHRTRYPSPSQIQKKFKPAHSVSFQLEVNKSQSRFSRNSSITRSRSSSPQSIVSNSIISNKHFRTRRNSNSSQISFENSISSASSLRSRTGKRSRSTSPNQELKSEQSTSNIYTHNKPRTPSPPLNPYPKKVGSTSSLQKKPVLKKKKKPFQILLSTVFGKLNKIPEHASPKHPNSKIKDPKYGKREDINRKEIIRPENASPKSPDLNNKDPKYQKKEDINEKELKRAEKEKNNPKSVLKKESKQTLKPTSSTNFEGQSKSAQYKSELKQFVKKDAFMMAKAFFEQNIWNKQCKLKNNCLPIGEIKEPRAHGFMNNFLTTVIRPKGKKIKTKYPVPITDQIRVHAFRKNFLNIVPRLSGKDKSVKQKAKNLVQAPFPRVHGFNDKVLALYKCGHLKAKDEQIAREKRKLLKSQKTLDAEASKTSLKSTKKEDKKEKKEDKKEKKGDKKEKKGDKKEKNGKKEEKDGKKDDKKKKKKKGDDEDEETDSDDDDENSSEKDKENEEDDEDESDKNCPYVLEDPEGKKCLKRCCCQFLKSLPPTPRENFRQNPGNPHFYPGPGFKRRWGYTLQLRRLERLEEERQRLCAEQKGIPYVGPTRQYQDFFDDTPVEDPCCCDTCYNIKKNKPKQQSNPDPHLYPRSAGFRHLFDNKEKVHEEDKRLEELRKECEDIFPDIKPLITKKSKSCLCRGKIVSGQKDKELEIKEIVENMAAICKCLDECDCNAALQAQAPYINLEDKPTPCCCAKNPMGKAFEPFDCHAGDPHQYPTVAAFKHAHDFVNKKKERIAKRKSIYDEIVQHGTDEEIQEARYSLYKQIMQDGTKEEKEEARKSFAQDDPIEEEIEDECDCPEIQEIVVMIEDSDCQVDPMYNNYQYQDQYVTDRQMWLQNNIAAYPELQENWEAPQTFEPVENERLETQPAKEEKLPEGVKRTSETQTPKTSGTQTDQKLKTSKTSIKEKTADLETKSGQEKSESENKEEKEKLDASKSISQTAINDENVETNEESEKTSKKGLRKLFSKIDIKQTKSKESDQSEKGKDDLESENLKKVDHSKIAKHAEEEKGKYDSHKISTEDELGPTTLAKDRKKRRCKASQKPPTNIRTMPKNCTSFKPRQYVPKIKPTCNCCCDKKTKIYKEKDNKTEKPQYKLSQYPCRVKKKTKCVDYPEIPQDESNYVCISEVKKKRKCIEFPKIAQDETECICISEIMKKCKLQPEKNQKNGKSCKCKCGAKSPRKSTCNLAQERTSKKSKTLSETEYWPQEDECEIYYPPPVPMETKYENLCQPVCEPPNIEIFNFPPPTYSTMYQEFPQYDICSSEHEMVFSVQVEQEQPFCEQVVFEESESSIYLTCNEDEEEHGEEEKKEEEDEDEEEEDEEEKRTSESSKSRKYNAKKRCKGNPYLCQKKEIMCCQMQPCNYKQHSAKIPCRCNEQKFNIPCRCNERLEKIPCRCKEQLVRFCECPQPQSFIKTDTEQEERKSEPVPITQSVAPVVKPKLPKKKNKWVFWKRVICKDGKEKFLKTSQCPLPKSILRVDRSANKYRYAHEDVELIECETNGKKESENIEQDISKNERLGSIKRNSKDADKSERAGSISKGNKTEQQQKTETNKRYSKDIEKNIRDSMTYEESDENESRYQNRRRRRRDATNPYRIIPCKCRKLVNERTNGRMSSKRRKSDEDSNKKKLVCKKSKSGKGLDCVEESDEDPEYMLVVETVDPEPCNQIFEITKADCKPTIELFPIDPSEPLPPCACKTSKRRSQSQTPDDPYIRQSL